MQIPGQTSVCCRYDPRAQEHFNPKAKEQEYIAALASLKLLVFFLTDDRQILSDSIPDNPDDGIVLDEATYRYLVHKHFSSAERSKPSRSRPRELQHVLAMVNQWITRQAARGANLGDNNVNSIYTEIIRGLVAETWN